MNSQLRSALAPCTHRPLHVLPLRTHPLLSPTAPRRALAGLIALSVWLCALPGFAGAEIAPARVQEIAAWLPARPAGFGPPITERGPWEQLARVPAYAQILTNAQSLARKTMPELTDDLYLDYSRTGNRDRCQKVLSARDGRVTTFTLAECLENRGRFVQPLAESIAALCQERTWVLPAHDRKLENFHGQTVEMDLRATAVAWDLATADYLLGDKLPPATRQLIRKNVERRVLQPFRDMVEGRRAEIFWLRATHNWNAVCLAGVTGAALALEESPARRAWQLAAAEHYIRFFLNGFTADGYCSEGIGYWNYGFGRFVMLTEAVRQATGGRLDFLADPAAWQPALFCTRTEIINGLYPTIADCHPGSRPDGRLVRYVSERLGGVAAGTAGAEFKSPDATLFSTALFSFLSSPLPAIPHPALPSESPLRTWFKDGGVLICRPASDSPAPFAAVLKAGHNAENHNHNDLGSFSVVLGKAMVVCDPGAEVYTARTFSAHRYDSKVLNSFGHAVPVVAGQLQRPGAAARAVVQRTEFRPEADVLTLDLASAYPVPALERLERTFTFRRGAAPALTVHDEVAYRTPQSFETALVTWGRWEKLSETTLLLTEGQSAVRVQIETGERPFQVSAETLHENVSTPKQPVRLGITLKSPVKAATVTLTITPVR